MKLEDKNYRRWMVAIGIGTLILAAVRFWIGR